MSFFFLSSSAAIQFTAVEINIRYISKVFEKTKKNWLYMKGTFT